MTLLTITPRVQLLVDLVREATTRHREIHGLDPDCVWVSDEWLNTMIDEVLSQGASLGSSTCPTPVVAGYPCIWCPGLEGLAVMTRGEA